MKFEFAILDFIQENISNPALDWLMPKITLLGNKGWIWIVTALVLIFTKKCRITGIQLGIGLLAGFIIGNLLLKNLVMRDRPCWINEDMQLLIAVPRDYSFPSGHSLSSFAAAGIIIQKNRKIGICAYILAILIAFSRLYLYVHFLTDVLLGIIIGTVIAFATVYASERYLEKRRTMIR